MHFMALFCAFVLISVSTIYSAPVTSGHFNAHALNSGMSMIDVEKDVVLSPGRGGNNFNAEAEDNGEAIVTIGGVVHGFAGNRTGEEFNAISRKQGKAQVRVNGDLLVENLEPTAKKFDAVADSGGKSMVQVGNVVILAGAKRLAREAQDETQRMPAAETPWGAAAVADHNTKPWESINHGAVGDAPVVSHDPIPEAEKPHESSSPVTEKPEVVAPIIGNDQHTPTSVVDVDTSVPISVAPPSTSTPSVVPDHTQVTETVHQPEPQTTESVITSTVSITTEKPLTVSEVPKLPVTELPANNNNVVIPHPVGGYSAGSLNAVSNGQGSKSVILVKGFVQY